MKHFICGTLVLLLGWACSKDEEASFPSSNQPEIVVKSDNLYSLPNRNFAIKALLKDDLGLRSVRISIAEFALDKTISFSTSEPVKEYNLDYTFLAPATMPSSGKYDVHLDLTDLSGNLVSKKMQVLLNGDFAAPALKSLKPAKGSVVFRATETKVTISFTIEDESGIDYFVVKNSELGINDSISLAGAKSSVYNKTFSIPSTLKEYIIDITTKDAFVEPNLVVTKLNFSVADGLTEMFLADVSKDSDLTTDICGVPMYFQAKNGDDFTFKYYADTDNKEIYLLGQETAFEPHCFGFDANGALQNSIDSKPIVLPKKGYYTITANIMTSVCTVTPYTPTSALVTKTITVCGSGFEKAGWSPVNTDYVMTPNPNNPYQLMVDMPTTGTDFQLTITGAGWSPYWRVLKYGVAPTSGSAANIIHPSVKGSFKLLLDTELERVTIIKK